MIQVVHVRERTTVVVQPRSEVVQVRQVAGMAQSVIQALVLAQQLADPAPNLGHPCRAPIFVVERALALVSNLSRIGITLARSQHDLAGSSSLPNITKIYLYELYHCARFCARSATALLHST